MIPEFKTISVECRQSLAYVTISNGVTNVIDADLMGDLLKLADWLDATPELSVVVFQSASPTHFLSHADFGLLKMLKDNGLYDRSAAGLYGDFLRRLRAMPKVMIAKVAGQALGSGAEFVFAMDMAFGCRDSARFALMEIMMGLLPGGGGALYLAEKVGRARALEACLGGADYDAVEAERFGLINRALPAGQLDGFVDDLAMRISRFSTDAVATNMEAISFNDGDMAGALDRVPDLFLSLIQQDAFDRCCQRYEELGVGRSVNAQKDWRFWAPSLSE